VHIQYNQAHFFFTGEGTWFASG